jgi:tripartite-type tricarboxylate transporter receptor subunit TctC
MPHHRLPFLFTECRRSFVFRLPLGRNAMTNSRRRFMQFAATAAALTAVSRFAWAQAYPTRPVRILVGYSPGGSTDILARLLGQWLSERLGRPFVIDNRPGAAGNIATEAVVRAPADGYTLLMVTSDNATNATSYDKLNFNFIRDIAPVASIASVSTLMVVHPSFPAKTVPEFIAYAKGNPSKVGMASVGSGSTTHLTGELFQMMADVKMVHVPYRGGAPAITDLLGGHVQVYFAVPAGAIEYIKTGKLRALAVTSATRSEVLPDVPSLSEFLPGYESISWFGVGAPRNAPAVIIDRLNKEINAGLADSRIKRRFADLGATVFPGSPADFGKLIADETEKWGKVIRAANIKAE